MGHRPRRRSLVIVSSLAALGLVAAACGGGDSDSGTTAGTAGTEAPSVDSSAPAGSEAPATDSSAPATDAPTPEAQQGGTIVWGIEADSSNPWRPAEVGCATSCYQVAFSVYDPLTVVTDSEPSWQPYLAESVTPNADNTVWTIKVRDGVTFHDGTPLDGAAVADNLNRAKKGILTGAALADVTDIAVSPTDPLAVDVTMSRPWTAFPLYLAGQIGMMASPTWLAASDTDDALKSKPVGTGPFVFESYAPNESFKATRNPNYWNQPYPYLDAVEFRPIPDALNRRDALRSGAIDILHTTNGETISEYRDNDDLVLEERTYKGPTNYTLLHVTQTLPDGAPSPLQDQRVRCALANAYDSQTVIATINAGVDQLADGPFSPEQVGYLEDTGYPTAQDMDLAKQLISEYKAEHPGPLNLSLATTQDDTNLVTAQFQKQWWEEAGIDSVTIDQLDQGTYIVTALLGNFQVFQWRNHSGVDLDQQYIWWHSSTAVPVGQIALNFGRIKDAVIDEALDANRGETDPAKKQGYAEAINQRFADQCYNIWGGWTTWAILHKPTVHIEPTFTTPEGVESAPTSEIANLRTAWVDQ
jgi:peptide/nickel transport system substrate-binding protein